MNGKPDTLKGSYYANPVVDTPTVPKDEANAYPEYYGTNICEPFAMSSCLVSLTSNPGPAKDETSVEGFENAFKDLGGYITLHLFLKG
jgi:hypothetical protein